MGKGKGNLEYWVAVVKPGRVLYEVAGVTEEIAKEALSLASYKLPIATRFVKRGGDSSMKPSELRAFTVEELKQKEQDTRKELFNLRFRLATGEVENPKRINALRKDIAKILTITSEKSKVKS